MASNVTRTMLVVITALARVVGTLGVTGGLGSSGATAKVSAGYVHHCGDHTCD